jgi:hypothetical protein
MGLRRSAVGFYTHSLMMRARCSRGFREAVIGAIIALDAERGLNDLGGAIAVVVVDSLVEQIGHGVYSSLMTLTDTTSASVAHAILPGTSRIRSRSK